MDAVLTAPERRTLVRLSLCPCFRRRWSSTCDALADGSLDVSRLRVAVSDVCPTGCSRRASAVGGGWHTLAATGRSHQSGTYLGVPSVAGQTPAGGRARLGLALAGPGAGARGQLGAAAGRTYSRVGPPLRPRPRWPSTRSLTSAPARPPRRPERWSRWTVLTRWANSLRLTWKQTWWCAWPRTASSAARRSRTLAVVDRTHMARSSSSRTPAPMAQPTARPAWSTRCTGP